jgi:hypothetical protein
MIGHKKWISNPILFFNSNSELKLWATSLGDKKYTVNVSFIFFFIWYEHETLLLEISIAHHKLNNN